MASRLHEIWRYGVFRILRRGPLGLPDISVGPPPGDDVRDASRRLLYYYIFNWKIVTGPKYYNGRAISRPNVEMNCYDIFMRYIFWSTWNAKVIAQSPAITTANGKKWRIVGGRCWEKKCLSWSLNRLQLSLYQQAGWARSKYNYWRRKGLTEQ